MDVASSSSSGRYNALKSKKTYDVSYSSFKDWCKKHGAQEITENVLLKYFHEKSEYLKSPTLYSEYSKLKMSLAVKEQTYINTYTKLTEFLKKKSIGYQAKKSRYFSRSQIKRFLREAPDQIYLMMKVALIFGIAGVCGPQELLQITVDHIDDNGSTVRVHIPQARANRKRGFIIDSVGGDVNMVEIYRKYASLRPKHTTHRRFFMTYRNGKCANSVVGVHTFGRIPPQVAKYLKLESPTGYTGHCFRRTSDHLKRSGGWPSVTMIESHTAEDPDDHQMEIAADVIFEEKFTIKVEEPEVTEVKMERDSPY